MLTAASLALAIVCGILAGFHTWRLRPPADTIVETLHAAGAEVADVGEVSVTPFCGMTIDSLCMAFPAGTAGLLRVMAVRTLFRWRTTAVLRNCGRVRRLLRTLATAESDAASAALGLADSAWFSSTVCEVRAEGIEVVLGRDTARTVVAGPAVLRLIPRTLPPRCSLVFALDTLLIGGVPLTDFRATGLLQQGALAVDSFVGRVLSGALHGMTQLDLSGMRLDTLRVVVEGARFAARLDDRAAGGVRLEEGISLAFALGPGTFSLDSLRGAGEIWAGRLAADDLPVLTMLARIFRVPALRRSTFDSLSAVVLLRPGGLQLERLAGYGAGLSFVSSGRIGWDGSLRQQVQGRLGASLLRGLDPVVRHSLLPGPRGSGRFACTVKGTLSQPVVTLDQRMVERAVEGMFQQYRSEFAR